MAAMGYVYGFYKNHAETLLGRLDRQIGLMWIVGGFFMLFWTNDIYAAGEKYQLWVVSVVTVLAWIYAMAMPIYWYFNERKYDPDPDVNR